MNMYAYVGNDPVNMLDPSGKVARYATIAGKIAIKGYKKVKRGAKKFLRDNGIIAPAPTSNIQLNENDVPEFSDGPESENKGQGQAEVGDCPKCSGDTSNKPGKIGKNHGLKPKEVKDRIHGAKNGKLNGNPDVEVCNDCGEIFPQTEDGTLGDSIGNIEDDY